MYIENRNLRGVQKFVDTKVVRRNSIGRIMVSANSVTPYNQLKVFRRRNIISVWILFLWREEMQYLTTAEFSKNGTFHRDEFLFIVKTEGYQGLNIKEICG